MQTMRILIRDNRGSIAVEMSLLMPIVIGVVMMLILLIVKGVKEGASLGVSQVVAYEYGNMEDEKTHGDAFEELKNMDLLKEAKGSIDKGDDYILATVSEQEYGEKYSVGIERCKREWRICTSRLRRWQLYGDVLYE